jgi:hypothetical protein
LINCGSPGRPQISHSVTNVPNLIAAQSTVSHPGRSWGAVTQQHPRTRVQLRSLGWSEDDIDVRKRNGSIRSVHRGVLLPAGQQLDAATKALAAVHAVRRATVGRWFAALLWGFISATDVPDNDVSLWVPPGVDAQSRDGIDVRITELAPADVTTWCGVPITTPARTVLDEARFRGVDYSLELADTALRLHACAPADFADVLSRLGRARGVVAAREVTRLTRPGTRSPGETRIRLVVVRAGFADPQVAFQILDEQGRVVAEADLAYPLLLIWIEYDGFDEHTRRGTFRKDRARHRWLERRGWKVLRTSDFDVTQPAAFLGDLFAAIADAPRRIGALPPHLSPEADTARAALGL